MSRIKTIKTKTLIASLLAVAIAAAAFAALAISQNAAAQSGDYDTDDDGLIEISSLEQLDAIRWDLDGDGLAFRDNLASYAKAFPNATTGMGCPTSGCVGYELTQNLDFADSDSYASGEANVRWRSGDGWLPIGTGSARFSATFDGNDHTIANLYLKRTSTSNPIESGLFGGTRGNIKRIGLTDVNVTGYQRVGGLVGENRGTITGSHVTGRVSGNSSVGGLVGANFRDTTDSYSTATVSGDREAGGLAGSSNGNITASHATGDVSGDREIGGLVGKNDGKITKSYATGDPSVNETSGRMAGGLVGWNAGTVSMSYAAGNASGSRDIGGLTGINSNAIRASYSVGSASGNSNVGGLVGGNTSEGSIRASYSTGHASGSDSIGGLVGVNMDNATVLASYAIGTVTGGQKVGGLLGDNRSLGLITNTYWDTQTTGQSSDVGDGVDSRAVGKTTAELQSPTGYSGIYAKWRFDVDDADDDQNMTTGKDDIWNFGTSSQYPALKVDLNGDGTATWQEFGPQRGQSPTPRPTPWPITPTPPAQADLKLSMLVSDNLGAGIYFYQLVVQNHGPSDATGVTLTADFPPSVSAVLAVPVRGTCTLGATVTCDLGNLRTNAMNVVTVVAGLDAQSSTRPISIANVTASESDPDPSNNRALN